jgi:hypothetical protein
MSGTRSIGNLAAIFTGDGSQLIAELKRIADAQEKLEASSGQSFGNVEKSMASAGKTLLLGAHAATLVHREIVDVIENIDKIPGVPTRTLESIHEMKYAFEISHTVLKRSIAESIGMFAQLGTSISFGLAALVYGADASADGLAKMNAEAEAWAKKDFNKKVAELTTEFDRLSVRTKGAMAKQLIEQAAALEKFSEDGTLEIEGMNNAMLENLKLQMDMQGGATEGDKEDAKLQSLRDIIQAQRMRNELSKEATDLMRQNTTLLEREDRAYMTTADAIADVTAQLDKLWSKKLEGVKNEDGTMKPMEEWDPEVADQWVQDLKKINALESERLGLIKKQKDWVNQLGSAFQSTLTGAMHQGITLGGIIRDLGQDILDMLWKLTVVNPLLNSIFGSLAPGNWKPLDTLFGGGRASGGDVSGGTSYLVGEEGPELFTPRGAGTIVPAGRTAAMLGGSGQNGPIYIDARGADRTGLALLQAQISELNRTFEARAIGAVIQRKFKSSGFRRGLAS